MKRTTLIAVIIICLTACYCTYHLCNALVIKAAFDQGLSAFKKKP